jgi:hypothetical protein
VHSPLRYDAAIALLNCLSNVRSQGPSNLNPNQDPFGIASKAIRTSGNLRLGENAIDGRDCAIDKNQFILARPISIEPK